MLVGRDGKEGKNKEHIWGEVDGRGNGKGESALKCMPLVVEYQLLPETFRRKR